MNEIVEPYDILINSEITKRKKMYQQLPGIYKFLPRVYNVLMKLPFYTGKLCDDDDLNMVKIQDAFQFFLYDLSFKIRNIISLMEIGSYHDAGILFRSFVESFIYYKYYIEKNDGDGLSNYILRKSRRSIKDIFEAVIPGYYDDIYGTLCCFAHNNPFTQAVFRGNVSRQIPLASNINNINLDWFSYIYNQLLPLIIGCVEMYNKVYPNNTIKQDLKLLEEKEYIYKYIKNDIEDRKKLYPKQEKMIDYYNKLIMIK